MTIGYKEHYSFREEVISKRELFKNPQRKVGEIYK